MMKRRISAGIPAFLFILIQFHRCNAFDLDGKIKGVLQPGLVLSSAALADMPLSNKGITRDLNSFTTGGTGPYQYTLTLSGALPGYLVVSLNGSNFFVGRNTAVAMPTTLASLPQMPGVELKVTDSAGSSISVTGVLQVHLKRVFVTKDVIGFDSALWNTGGSNNYSGCASGDPVEKANCRCEVSAAARGIPGPGRFRAWLSSTSIDAACNLVGSAAKNCVPAQYAGGPWYNMIGNLIAEDLGTGTPKGLLPVNVSTDQPLQNPIQYYDDASSAGSAQVWNGSNASGFESVGSTCSNWSSGGGTIQYGRVDGLNTASTSPFWNGGSQTCTAIPTMGFYCFEAD